MTQCPSLTIQQGAGRERGSTFFLRQAFKTDKRGIELHIAATGCQDVGVIFSHISGNIIANSIYQIIGDAMGIQWIIIECTRFGYTCESMSPSGALKLSTELHPAIKSAKRA